MSISCVSKTLYITVLLTLFLRTDRAWTQQTPTQEAPKIAAGKTAAATGPATAVEDPDEDWSILSLPKGELHAIEPLLVEQEEDREFTREFLQVQWRNGDPIHLFVIKPTGVKNPPVILYLYSYPSEADRFLNASFCKFLVKNGYAAVGFVSALTGHRYHDRPMKEWFVSNLQEALGSSVHDVQMIVNYLATRGDLDMDRVGMFGDGSGATVAILAAAADPRIKVLDLVDPWGDWPDWLAQSTLIPEKERPDYLKPAFLKEVSSLDPLQWLPQLRSRTIRLQNIRGVTVTPDSVKKRIESAAPAATQIVRYEDVKTFVKNVASTGAGFDWIKEQLRRNASAQGTFTNEVQNSKTPAEVGENGR